MSSNLAPERTESAPEEVLVMEERVKERREWDEETDMIDPSHVQRSSSLVEK